MQGRLAKLKKNMEIIARSNSVSVAPRKLRLVAKAIAKLSPSHALSTLSFIKKRGSVPLLKTLKNAIANAKYRNLKEEDLVIKNIDISEGRALKRFRASTRGRTHPYKKRTTNIKIILEAKNGTKS